MGREPDDAVVLRNPARGRELVTMAFFLPLIVINLVSLPVPGWLTIVLAVLLLALVVRSVLAQVNRIVVHHTGVDVRAVWGRRYRLSWAAIDRFTVRGRCRVDVHLTSGRRISAMRFAPVEDESPASTVALLEYQRRRLGGATAAGAAAATTR